MNWTGPSFQDFDAALDETTMAALGETVLYKQPGYDWSEKKAIVDYSDQDIAVGQGEAIAQNVTVEILKSAVVLRPDRNCRIRLAKLAGDFVPVNVKTDDSGNSWVFEVVTARA